MRRTALAEIAMLLALLVPTANAWADEESPAPPYDAGRIYWNTTTILNLNGLSDPSSSGDAKARMRIYEFLTLETRDAGAKGLSFNVSGWIGGDLLDPYASVEEDVVRGDLLYGNVAWKGLDDNLRIKAGRHFVWAGAAVGGLVLDGVSIAGDLPWDIELSAYGGIAAPPRFRYAADEYKYDYAAGARLAWAPWDIGHIALSYGREGHEDQIAREQVGIDLDVTYFDWLGVYASTLVDLVNKDLDEGRVHVDAVPIDGLHVEVNYEGVDTTSRIRKTSIFHVFSDDVYHAAGASVDWQSPGWLGLNAGYRHYIYTGDEMGYKLSGGAANVFFCSTGRPGTSSGSSTAASTPTRTPTIRFAPTPASRSSSTSCSAPT